MDPEQNKPASDASVTEKTREASQQAGLAMELPFTLVAAVVIGGGIGFFLDRWLHTKPILMLLIGAFGFFGGVREVLRRLAASNNG